MERQTRIMIVEDEALIAADLEQRLLGLGYDVPAIADSAVTALDLIEQHRPDLVLMDIRIHGSIDGIALASHVKQQFKLPVIFMTAHADSSTLARAKLAEPFGYLVKPVGAASLPSAIEVALYKHRMEQDLRRQRSWLETTLRCIGDGVILTSQTGAVNYINDAALGILETTREAVVGKPLDQVFKLRYHSTGLPVEDLEMLAETEDHAIPLPAGIHIVTSTEKLAPIEGSISSCRLPNEKFGSVVLFRDIAVREAAERERRDEQKMIAVGRLAAGVASGLDDLQGALKRAMQLSADGASPGEAQAQLREAATSAASLSGRLRSLVRQKGEELKSIPLRRFIEARLPDLRDALPASVSLTASFDDEDAAVHAAPAQLARILTNLVANAGEAMPDGGAVTIEVTRSDGPQGEDMSRIAIRDTGPGLLPDAMENLFEPFYSTKSGGHSGLGLASAYASVSMLGGFLAVDSETGAGATIEIFLPATTANPPVTEARWPTILLVEPNESLRRILHNYLEAHDYNLIEAVGPADALDLVEVFDGPIDLLVTDLASDSLAAQLKAARPELKMLFATGSEETMREMNGVGRIEKPIRKADLLRKVAEMVR